MKVGHIRLLPSMLYQKSPLASVVVAGIAPEIVARKGPYAGASLATLRAVKSSVASRGKVPAPQAAFSSMAKVGAIERSHPQPSPAVVVALERSM